MTQGLEMTNQSPHRILSSSTGFLTSVTLEIIPSRRYVKIKYIPVYSIEQLMETLERELEKVDSSMFIECIMYTRNFYEKDNSHR